MKLKFGYSLLALTLGTLVIAAIAVPAYRFYLDHDALAQVNNTVKNSIDQWQVYDSTDPKALVSGIYQSMDEPHPLTETLYTPQGIELVLRENPKRGALHLLYAPGTKVVFKPDYESLSSVLLWTCEVQFAASNGNKHYGGTKTNEQIAHHYFPKCSLG